MNQQCCRLVFNLLLVIMLTPLLVINVYGLTIEDGGEYTIDVGNHYYDELVLGENSTLYVQGETYIFVDRLFSEDGAKIEYIAGTDRQNKDKWLRFEVMDASAMVGTLTLIGSGATNSNKGIDGSKGKNGRDAHWHRLKSVSANPGSPGQNGGDGEAGENGMHIEVNIAYLPIASYVRIISNGGNGGDGGNGGQGGNGGNAKYDRPAKDGGNGGNGGNGGQGGNGGDIVTFLLYSGNPSVEKRKELKILAANNIIAKPGQGGKGGNAGNKGYGGVGGTDIWYKPGEGGNGLNGSNGREGTVGKAGEVPPTTLKFIGTTTPPLGQYTIYGNILDNNSNPISGVTVEINKYDSVITDDNGYWEINNLPVGDYEITASKDGYEFSPAGFSLNDENAKVEVNISMLNVEPSVDVDYIDKCVTKFSNYFGTKIDGKFSCGEDNYLCQKTTGGSDGDVIMIAIHKSERDIFGYYWNGWNSLDLSYCD